MYRCNCGQDFESPQERTVHSVNCIVMRNYYDGFNAGKEAGQRYCDAEVEELKANLLEAQLEFEDALGANKKARQEGRREVVNWLRNHCACFDPNPEERELMVGWRVQLKVWGLEG